MHKLSCDALHILQVLQSDIDLLHPPAELEKRSHKLKRLVQSPNSFFMDVKCQGCFQMCALGVALVFISCQVVSVWSMDYNAVIVA